MRISDIYMYVVGDNTDHGENIGGPVSYSFSHDGRKLGERKFGLHGMTASMGTSWLKNTSLKNVSGSVSRTNTIPWF